MHRYTVGAARDLSAAIPCTALLYWAMSRCSAFSYCEGLHDDTFHHTRCEDCGERLSCWHEDYMKTCDVCHRRHYDNALDAHSTHACGAWWCPNAYVREMDYTAFPPDAPHTAVCSGCHASLACNDIHCPTGLCKTCCEARSFTCTNCDERYPPSYGCGCHPRPPCSWHGVVRDKPLCCRCCDSSDTKMPCVSCGRVLLHGTVGRSFTAAHCGRCVKRLEALHDN